jgi:hypothetical protein
VLRDKEIVGVFVRFSLRRLMPSIKCFTFAFKAIVAPLLLLNASSFLLELIVKG